MFSQDGKYVLYGNPLYGTKVLETATGKELHQLDTAIGNISSVAISQDGKYLAAPGLDNTVRVWEISTGEEISSISQGNDFNSILSVALSSDGKYVISGGCDELSTGINERCLQGGAIVWETMTGRQIVRITEDDAVASVAFSPDGKHVISGSKDGTVSIWEVTTGSEVSSIDTDANASLGFSWDGKYMVTNTGVDRNFFSVWELASGKEIARMNHGDLIESFAISPDGRLVASGGWDHVVRIWDVMTGGEIMNMTQDDLIFSIAFSPDGRHVIYRNGLYYAKLWDLKTRKEIAELEGIEGMPSGGYNPSVTDFIFSADGQYFATKTLDHVVVREVTTGNKLAELPFRRDLLSMAFSPNGKYIVSGGCDNFEAYPSDHCLQGNVTIWEVSTGKEFLRINQSEDIFFVAFSPDGKYVASGGCEQGDESTCFKGAVHIWETATGKEIVHIPQDGLALSVEFSHDGKYIVSYGYRCGQSAEVCSEIESHVWEVVTGTEIINKTGITYALFSPDGKYLISDADDGNIHVSLWQPQDMVTNACQRVSRNLTYGEWKQYVGTVLPYQAVCRNLPIPESSLKEIALEALSDLEDPERVPTALDKVTDVLESDETVSNPDVQATQVITNVIQEQLDTMADASSIHGYILRYMNINSEVAILENANTIRLNIDPNLLNLVCWEGSLYGYAERVLPYCEQAVALVANDPEIRDSRGLARALTGDFSGAIADFEFAVQGFREFGQDELAIEREAWIKALKSGQNPFDEQTLETLRN
jgi:WD40 repeat protein